MTQKRLHSFLLSTLVASVIGTLGAVPEAFALTTLKQVQVTNGSQIDLLFDGKITKSQVHTEFVNDTIQISLTDSAVYPAKISSVSGGSITKVFAYQYAPKLVRCRLSVKGKADSFKDLLQISPSGKMLTIRLGAGVVAAKAKAPVEAMNAQSPADTQDDALLAKVLKSGTTPEPVKAAAPVVAPVAKVEVSEKSESLGRPERPLAGGKALPNPMFAFGKLIIVLGIFGLVAIGAKKVLDRRGTQTNAGMMGALGRFAQANLGKKSKMIEVLSTHYLGPKKSIAVVKIANRTLVLGVTNEAINLITQLSGDSAADLIEEDLGDESGIFSNLLKTESGRPTAPAKKPATSATSAGAPIPVGTLRGYAAASSARAPVVDPIAAEIAPQTGIRSQIRNRLEGLKPL